MSAPQKYPILWWTLSYDSDRYNKKIIDRCGLPYSCMMTLDRSYYEQSPLVIFQAWQIPRNDFIGRNDLPSKDEVRTGKKAWVLNSVESPTWIMRDKELTQLFSYRWTNWFNADFVEHYFSIGPNDDSLISKVLQPPLKTLEEKNTLRKRGPLGPDGQHSKPLAPVAWIVSNCDSFNGRHYYVYQLLKFVDIDIFGKCMPTRSWPVNADGKELEAIEVVSQYKFYLALENSNCDDYVTEKLERAYETGAIPIVDGPADYARFDATGNALIKLDDFSTPRQLGKYINKLDGDDELYLERLRYKVPKDPHHKPSTKDLSRAFLRTWSNSGNDSDWGPDWRGAECGLCELTHDLKEGIVQLDGTKHIGIDKTCVFKKHYHPLWVMEYHWRVTLSIMLAVAFVLYVLSRKSVRVFLLGIVSSVLPKSWLHRYSHLTQNESLHMGGQSRV